MCRFFVLNITKCCQGIVFILYNEPTNAQLIDKLLYCSYMFRHYCVIIRELAVSTLLSYISMSMQSVVIQFKTSHIFYCFILFFIYFMVIVKIIKDAKYTC